MMAKSANLGAAKNAKQDEFYTQLSDIEKEMRHYRRHFKDKTILCNCDDPFESNFFKLSEMHADHIKPWAKGGPTTAENCQMLCRDCNLRKSDD